MKYVNTYIKSYVKNIIIYKQRIAIIWVKKALHFYKEKKMSDVKQLDASNFDETTTSGVTLVDFWAEWCGPCKMLGPILEEVAKEIGDDAVIAKVDVDKAQELATRYSVRSIPAIFILKDGEVNQQFVGLQDKQTLVDAVKSAL